MLECPRCRGPMRILATIHPPETTAVCLLSGALGAGLGAALVAAMASWIRRSGSTFSSPPEISAATVVGVAAVLAAVGILAGMLPALRAARVDPAESLRASWRRRARSSAWSLVLASGRSRSRRSPANPSVSASLSLFDGQIRRAQRIRLDIRRVRLEGSCTTIASAGSRPRSPCSLRRRSSCSRCCSLTAPRVPSRASRSPTGSPAER